MRNIRLLILLIAYSHAANSQDDTLRTDISKIPPKYFESVSQKANDLEQKLDEKTNKYLSKLKKQEEKIYRRLYKKDSVAAKQIFGDLQERYNSLQTNALEQAKKLGSFSKVYSSKLDSLTTAFKFLDNSNFIVPELKGKLQQGLSSINELQDKLNQTDQIRKILKERRMLLTEQLEKFGMVKELKQFNKLYFYYNQQWKELKQTLENPARLEAKVMELLVNIPAFRNFFNQNSQLASLFRLPGSPANNLPNAMAGLQTRASVQQDIINRLGTGVDVQRMIQENMQNAQVQMSQLKNELNQRLPGGGGSDEELPDFKIRSQKTKSFLQRLELGTNFQTQRAGSIYPVSTDFGFSLGYRASDKAIVGVGGSYRVGWGTDWNNIRITHQGIGIRSFAEIKFRGSLWIVAGYEQNYRSEIRNFNQLRDHSMWQHSGLIGLSKVAAVKSKLLKKTKFFLLWDYLSYSNVPKNPPFVLRIGYSFK